MTVLSPRYLLYLTMLASAGALITALIAQYGFGIAPCVLCSYQRIPYAAVLVFGLCALSIGQWDHRGVASALGGVFLAGAALAFYHNGVEQQWWVAATSCGDGGALPSNVLELRLALSEGDMPRACDDISWSLFGLSITVYNNILSLALAAICFFSVRAPNG